VRITDSPTWDFWVIVATVMFASFLLGCTGVDRDEARHQVTMLVLGVLLYDSVYHHRGEDR
jgi:hypothetical protein